MKLTGALGKPIMTEKTVSLSESGKYSFVVNKRATKGAIAEAVSKEFGVEVASVKVSVVPGKPKRVRGTANKFIKTPSWKKAIVTLKAGQKIDMFSKLLGDKN